MSTLTTQLVHCDRPFCGTIVHVTDAVYNQEHDLFYCSANCDLEDAEVREGLEIVKEDHRRLDGIYNLSLCCHAPINDWGLCVRCGSWYK